jgi:hypothetical protein
MRSSCLSPTSTSQRIGMSELTPPCKCEGGRLPRERYAERAKHALRTVAVDDVARASLAHHLSRHSDNSDADTYRKKEDLEVRDR